MTNRREGQTEWGTVVLGALAILVVGAVIGVVANRFSTRPLPLFASEAALRPGVSAGVSYLDVNDAKSTFDAGTAVFVDARLPEEYAQGHILGAVNLPADEFDAAHRGLAGRLRKAPAVIVYCANVACEEGARVADGLAAEGHSAVHLMFSGWEEWQAAGYPSEGSGPQ